MIQMLISQSPDIQKVLAFEGAFEKLFNTVTHEGGLEGGVVSQDALRCVDGLLRFNTSNQVIDDLSSFEWILIDILHRVTSVKHPSQRYYVPSCSSRLIFPCKMHLHKTLHCNSGTPRK